MRDLTPRQTQILRLLAFGLTNRRIPRELGLSENTDRTHVERIREEVEIGDGSVADLLLSGASPKRRDVAMTRRLIGFLVCLVGLSALLGLAVSYASVETVVPTTGWLVGGFNSGNDGLDISGGGAYPGENIYAFATGTIVLADVRNKWWGCTVAIDHGPPGPGVHLYSSYAHMGPPGGGNASCHRVGKDELPPDVSTCYFNQPGFPTVLPGQVVPKGQLIGRQGCSGNTDGVHLHFSLGLSSTGPFIPTGAAGAFDPTTCIGAPAASDGKYHALTPGQLCGPGTPCTTDSDGDGVCDDVDACPNEPGPPSNNGCPVVQAPHVSVTVSPDWNGYQWNNEDVSINWVITPSGTTNSPDCSVTGVNWETYHEQYTCTATNSAGSASATTREIKIDKTNPGISGSTSPPANANGWNNTDVTAHFACYDQGPVQSRIASCTADQVITGEGRNLTASGTAVDKADNSNGASVSVNIDRTPPVTAVTLNPPVPNGKRGWYISDVTVCLNPSDPDLADGSPGSGVDVTRYRVNGGAWQDYAGCFVVGTESWDNDVDFYSEDAADNVEAEKDVHFKLDKTPPDISISDGVLDGLHWDQVHLERGILTNSDTLALSGRTTDNLCLWEVRAVNLDSGQVLDSEQPVSILIFPPPTPASMDYRLDVPLHQGINNIDVVAEDCAGWEKHLPIQVVYVIPGPYDPRSKGFWYNAVKTGKYSEADVQTLLGYVNVVSDVYGPATRNIYGLVSLANYRGILSPVTSDMETLQKAQLLATWLNLVSGRVAVLTPADLTKVKGWAQVVDNTGGSPLTFALNVPMEGEEVDQTRLASRGVYEIAKNLLDAFNNRRIIP